MIFPLNCRTAGRWRKKKTVKVSVVDQEKAQKDALYDGYFAIITSELDYKAEKIREVYHGL